MKQKFFVCNKCGNIIEKVKDTKLPIMCCEEKMEEMEPGIVDAAKEKHIPIYKVEGNKVTVKVGETEHPMKEEHYIEWISIQTKEGKQIKELKPNDKPEICFAICEDDEVESVYAFCNLHKLWKNTK